MQEPRQPRVQPRWYKVQRHAGCGAKPVYVQLATSEAQFPGGQWIEPTKTVGAGGELRDHSEDLQEL